MNKCFFTFLLILMGISILGVIVVQLVWINNAIRVKNELFDRSVTEALQKTANKLEERQDFEVLASMPIEENIHWHETLKVVPPTPPRPIKIIKKSIKPGKVDFEFEVENEDQPRVFTFSNFVDSDQEHEIIVTSTDTILTDVQTFVTSRVKQLDSLECIVDSMVAVSPLIKQRIELKTNRLKDLSSRVVSEITAFGLEDVKLKDVREVAQAELADNNIPIDFELALLDKDTIRELSNSADSLLLIESPYQVRLFPNAVFQKNKKLSIFFPNQNSHIYRSVSWLLLASLLFSMFILITFALSIHFILRQKKISEMKTDFINNMTHEFKTPIATIAVAADSIVNEKVIGSPEQVNFFVGMIKKENTRMNHQVEDILTIARLDKKDFEFHWETYNVHELIEEAVQGIAIQVERKNGKIISSFEATNPMITADKTHCINIIHNLLDNANKYSEDKPQITVLTKNFRSGVLISVVDKGIGMSKQVQSHIFERFYRQTSGNIHNVKGFGLGLSYVRAVVEANQGTIEVQSEPGKGSRFDVFLPFLRE